MKYDLRKLVFRIKDNYLKIINIDGKKIIADAIKFVFQGTSLKADFNCDNTVDFTDLWMLTEVWLDEEVLLSEDITRNGFVDFADFVKFAESW